jgi:hypothetical protein
MLERFSCKNRINPGAALNGGPFCCQVQILDRPWMNSYNHSLCIFGGVPLKDQIEQRVILSRLFDIYEPVLTGKQREAFRLHVLEDWSLSEVAERLEVSRQGAHDLVQRSKERLTEMEGLLGFSAKEDSWERIFRDLGEWYRRYSTKIPHEAASVLAGILTPEEREDRSD